MVLSKKDQEMIERQNRSVFERRLNVRKKNALVCARCGKTFPLGRKAAFNNHIKSCKGNKGIPELEI